MSRQIPVLALVILAALIFPGAANADFGFLAGSEGFSVATKNKDGTAVFQAGGHPYVFEAKVGLNSTGGESDGDLKQLRLSLPAGLLFNPTAIDECDAADFATPRVSPYETSASGESCPNSTQIGVIGFQVAGATRHFGLFNLKPAFGVPLAMGASPFGVPMIFNFSLREADAGFDVSLDVPQSFDLQATEMEIWGVPWEKDHDGQRGNCLNEQTGGPWGEEKCLVFDTSAATNIKSVFTLPTTPCGKPFAYGASATSWQGESATTSAATNLLLKCNRPLVTPKVQLMTDDAAARTGMAFNIAVNDGGGMLNPAGIARPAIKEAIASLPEGLTINPSLGAGLGTCTEAQFAAETPFEQGCPNNSKIGTVEVQGAIGLSESLRGSLYVATPYANPFGSIVALYMTARSPRRGILLKSIGELEPDLKTGRLVATFDQLPRLLYTHFELTLREGQRSTLVSPPTCGSYVSDLALASWAEPTVFKHEASAFGINSGEGGGPCPSGGLAPFSPGLLAGSLSPQAKAYSPFYLRMTRSDAEQEITSYSAIFPKGLLGKIAGVPFCPDAAIEAAKGRTGIEERDDPSCPAASSIGRTEAGFGVGGVLAWAPGGLYLAGPFRGAPLSIVAIDSALVGPFDLGVVIVRSAIRVDPRTTQVAVDSEGSDPIPHILKGIPIHLRDIRVHVERPDFTVNPTSCDPSQVASNLTAAGSDLFSPADDPIATTTNRYQLLNCSLLPFKPKLKFRFTSGFKRRAFPSLRTELRAAPKDANLKFVSVTLPRTEFVAQEHLRNICTTAHFKAKTCPADSVYGKVRVFTPLLDEPLEGLVYLRSSSAGGLPDMVFDLRARGGIRIEVVGKIDSVHESLRATFSGLPDAPVSRVVMNLFGGKQGLIQNEKNICKFPQFANARLIGQNNLGSAIKPLLETRCPKKKKRKRAAHRHGGTR
jgi:hypothetical protein